MTHDVGNMTLQPALPRPSAMVALLKMAVKLAPTGWKFYKRSILLRKMVVQDKDVALPEGYQWLWAGPEELNAIDRHPEQPRLPPTRGERHVATAVCVSRGALNLLAIGGSHGGRAAFTADLGHRPKFRSCRCRPTTRFFTASTCTRRIVRVDAERCSCASP